MSIVGKSRFEGHSAGGRRAGVVALLGLVLAVSSCVQPAPAPRAPGLAPAPVVGTPYCPLCTVPPNGVGFNWQVPSTGGAKITAYRLVIEVDGAATVDQILSLADLTIDTNGVHWSIVYPAGQRSVGRTGRAWRPSTRSARLR